MKTIFTAPLILAGLLLAACQSIQAPPANAFAIFTLNFQS